LDPGTYFLDGTVGSTKGDATAADDGSASAGGSFTLTLTPP